MELFIKPIKRKALLPAIDYKELKDPPEDLAKNFQIHDILMYIAFLRRNNIIFRDLDQLNKTMPNIYSRADELIKFKDSSNIDYQRDLDKHKSNLVITKYNRDGRLSKIYQAGEVISELRDLYLEGYNLNSVVLNRECIGIYPAAMHNLGRFYLSKTKNQFGISSKEF